MLKRISPLLLLVFLCLFATSCALHPISVTGLQDVKMDKLDAKGVQMTAGLKVKNENLLGFGIYGSKLDVKMNGVSLGTVKLDKKIKVRGKSDTVHPVKMSASFQDLFSSLPALMQMAQKQSGNVEINGYIKVGIFLFRKKIPVNINQQKVPVAKS